MLDRRDRIIVARNVRRLRILYGLSQTGMAKQLFISQQQVSDWEGGQHSYRPASLKRLAAYFNTTIEELLKNDRP